MVEMIENSKFIYFLNKSILFMFFLQKQSKFKTILVYKHFWKQNSWATSG